MISEDIITMIQHTSVVIEIYINLHLLHVFQVHLPSWLLYVPDVDFIVSSYS